MNKKEFLKELEDRLQGLPKEDIDEKIEFFSEMIDDKCVEGNKTEEEAISEMGSIDEIVSQIVNDASLLKIVKQKIKPKRRLNGFEIALLIIGFPLWFPLLLVFLILTLVFCLLIWILVLVTYTVELALIAFSGISFIAFIQTVINSNVNPGYIGLSLLGLGIALIFIFVCILATKVNAKLTKKIIVGIKRKLIGRGNK